MTISIKAKSVRKHSDGSYSAQVIVEDQDDNKAFYACRLNKDGSIDADNLYEFVCGQWRLTHLSADLIKGFKRQLMGLVKLTGHLFKRAMVSSSGETRYAMYSDTVISVSNGFDGGHGLKVGDRVFYTHDAIDLTPINSSIIRFEVLGMPFVNGHINLDDNPALKARLQKQHDFAYKAYSRARDSRPIGGMSWASLQNDRKEFGRSTRNHRELQRSRHV